MMQIAAIRKEIEPHSLMADFRHADFPKTKKKRKARVIRLPMPPQHARSFAQQLHAADEFWNQLMASHEAEDGKGHNAMLAMFSCFINSFIADEKMKRDLMIYFDQRLNDEQSRREASKS